MSGTAHPAGVGGVIVHRPRTDPAAWSDLRARVRSTRWPAAPDDIGWASGADPHYLRDLAEHWADRFDWPLHEDVSTSVPRYRVELEPGVVISFQHIRGKTTDGRDGPPLPLVLTHGWPDSSWRYSKVIDLLTDPASHGGDPADAFDLVIPDLPGFGYSDLDPRNELNTADVARLWAELMALLGYERFGAAGGDIGSAVSRFLALNHPEHVVGVHRMDAGLPVHHGDPAELTAAERQWLASARHWSAVEGAYAALHRTKPLTPAFALTDSPVGLAAWVVEKLHSWAHVESSLDEVFTKDEVLTLLTPMWLNKTILPAMRMYRANATIPAAQHARSVDVPSGFTIHAHDVLPPPKAWLRRLNNVTHYRVLPQGGHFAPFECPTTYARELTDFFRPLRPTT